MNTVNINTKSISEFTTDDTIYISDMNHHNQKMYLCQFVKYEKGLVYGTIIPTDDLDNREKHRLSRETREIKSKLEKCALYGSLEDASHTHYFWFKPTGYALAPEESYKVNAYDAPVKDHPSYGLVSFHRRESNQANLFGSSIQHGTTIVLEVKRAEHNRSLNYDRYYGKEHLIQLELSQAQFAELITSMNRGDGTPCTLKYVNNERMPEPPFKSKQDVFNQEFGNEMHNMNIDLMKMVREATELLSNKSTLTKSERQTILDSINAISRKVGSTIPFIAESFGKQMDKTVTEAKSEVESFVQMKVNTLGIEQLKNINLLQSGENG